MKPPKKRGRPAQPSDRKERKVMVRMSGELHAQACEAERQVPNLTQSDRDQLVERLRGGTERIMSEDKKPQPGEWWRMRNGEIAYVALDVVSDEFGILAVERTCHGEIAAHAYNRKGDYFRSLESEKDLVTHLPDCTGFDWKEPEPEPKYVPFTLETYPRDAWVRVSDIEMQATAVSNAGPYLHGAWYRWHELLSYTIDGKPAGRLVDAWLASVETKWVEPARPTDWVVFPQKRKPIERWLAVVDGIF